MKQDVLMEKKDFAAQVRKGEFKTSSFNKENRTVNLEYVGSGLVKRYSWADGIVFWEELSTEKGHVRLERLNNGAPLLNDHQRWNGLEDQIGVCESATETHCVVRFSARDSVNPIMQDVADGIYRNVSVGYFVHTYEQIGFNEADGIPIWRAIDWEPYEVSLVTIPADANTGVRQSQKNVQSCCTVIQRNLSENPNEEKPAMKTNESNTPENGGESVRANASAPQRAPVAAPVDPKIAERAANEATLAERQRAEDIQTACRKAGMPAEFAGKMVSEGKSISEVRELIIDSLADKQDAPITRSHARAAGGHDEVALRLAAMENAIIHRADPSAALSEQAQQYRGMSLVEMGRDFLGSEGRGLTKMEIAKRTLHTTSDFSGILSNVANKRLRKAYALASPTYKKWATRGTAADFKEMARYALSSMSSLERVPEGGEYRHGTFGEGAEKYSLSTYGKIIGFSRQAMINDDLSSFTRIPQIAAQTAARLENRLVYAQLGGNPNMADGVALFHATHNNLITNALDVTGLGAARAKMRQQKDPSGEDFLNLETKFLILPSAMETIGDQLQAQITPALVGSVNPFSRSYEIIVEPMLDAYAADDWYTIAGSDQIDTVEYAFLEGEEGPQMETRDGWEVDGIEFKIRHDFAAKAIDFRGMVKSTNGT